MWNPVNWIKEPADPGSSQKGVDPGPVRCKLYLYENFLYCFYRL